MGIIQKRADELKPGDVLPVKDGWVVLIGFRYISADCVELMGCAMTSDLIDIKTVRQREFISAQIAVEVPDLTPAQQHADKLLRYAREFYDHINDKPTNWGPHFKTNLREFLDELAPPEPPTLAEALEALAATTEYSQASVIAKINGKSPYANALDILDRARRAGGLKEPQSVAAETGGTAARYSVEIDTGGVVRGFGINAGRDGGSK